VRRRLVAAAVLVLLAAAVPASARAEDVDARTFRSLAERAASGDGRALERLRGVDAVAGRAVDMDAALAGASGAELEARLDALAARGSADAADPAASRAEAGEILDERRFRGSESPRPLRRLLDWLGDRLEPLGDPFRSVAERTPGGNLVLWLAVAAAVLLTVTLVSARSARRRAAALELRSRAVAAEGRPRAAEVERAAADAERRGEWERALRLRFRAGLLRLDEQRVLAYRESLTSGEAARRLRSREFDRLARVFDEVVYGRRPAAPDDLAAAREGWGRVLAEARPA
jgi:hypothetical protein